MVHTKGIYYYIVAKNGGDNFEESFLAVSPQPLFAK